MVLNRALDRRMCKKAEEHRVVGMAVEVSGYCICTGKFIIISDAHKGLGLICFNGQRPNNLVTPKTKFEYYRQLT